MPTTGSGISYEELEGSPIVDYSERGVTAVRRFRVAWDQYEAFILEIGGHYEWINNTVVAVAPVSFPGPRPNLIAESARVEPFEPSRPDGQWVTGLAIGTNRYDNGALVTVRYRQLFPASGDFSGQPPSPPSVPDQTFLTYENQIGAEWITPPARSWKWPSGKPLGHDAAPAILIPTTEHVVNWHRVLSVPYSQIRSCRGRVNSGTFIGVPAGCLLFLGARISRTGIGPSLAKVQYLFAERTTALNDNSPTGWNYLFNPDPQSSEHWQQIQTTNPPARLMYASADFSVLFQYGSA